LNLKQRLEDKKLPHEILNVNQNTTRKEIIDSYKSLSKVYHPDKTNELPTECIKLTTAIFRIVKDSRDELCKGKKKLNKMNRNMMRKRRKRRKRRKEKKSKSIVDSTRNNFRRLQFLSIQKHLKIVVRKVFEKS